MLRSNPQSNRQDFFGKFSFLANNVCPGLTSLPEYQCFVYPNTSKFYTYKWTGTILSSSKIFTQWYSEGQKCTMACWAPSSPDNTVEDVEGTCGAASELERRLVSFEWPYSHCFCKVHNKPSQAGIIAINICVPLPNFFSADAEQLADLVILPVCCYDR